ncbi:MAG: SLBB domain-containing protein, partial [Rhodospirillaceae bacterium]|nr:SLBB domain-containing protein [Rhodospirillaceae bacterium]
RPTVVDNVETLYWVAEIIGRGANWYAEQGHPRFYTISGRVKQPGVKLAPATTTARQLIEDFAGGMADGHSLNAFLPGGASGGIFPARLSDTEMGFGKFEAYGGFVGSGALIVLSDRDDPWDVARELAEFFAFESCGQCTPCRIGTEKLCGLLKDPKANRAIISELAKTMADASICGLGQAAPNPALTLLNLFDQASDEEEKP